MANIKEQISDFRKSTPKHIQWLLLAAAFIVVLILLTLLFTSRKDTQIIKDEEGSATEISFLPVMLDFGKTPVGEVKTSDVAISANNAIKVLAVNYAEKVDGFELKQSCEGLEKIETRPTKCMYVTYAPKKPMADKKIILTVSWRLQNAPDSMQHTSEYYVNLGATGTAIADTPVERPVVKKPEPVDTPIVETKTDTDIDIEDDDEDLDLDFDIDDDIDVTQPTSKPIIDEPVAQPQPTQKNVSNEIRNDIKSIAPSDPFASAKENKISDDATVAPEGCSDFAIPGYGPSGNQIGWIKPERGAYYFHPFSDKECKTPTGIYNPDNGIITDIKGNGKRIGTDAEHIGYSTITNGTLPKLSNPATKKASENAIYYAASQVGQNGTLSPLPENTTMEERPKFTNSIIKKSNEGSEKFMGSSDKYVLSSQPYDRQFILRQYKPIPATIVSEVRADPSLYRLNEQDSQSIQLPVRATVDRNVYADDGRNIILPTGTLMLGYVTGDLPGPYTAVGRMQIKWYQFILPNGVEFNFEGSNDPISADSQGRMGVPGRGSTDYLEQFVMPMLTAIVPAAVNMIAPVADKFVNQIDLDNNTVVQSGTMRSSELAKNEIITAWNQVAQKLLVDMMDNTVPPFSIAAGTRITVYSPEDLIVSCGDPEKGATGKCALGYSKTKRRSNVSGNVKVDYNDASWIGQARSFNWSQYCTSDGKVNENKREEIYNAGLDYSSVLFYCQSNQYKAINNARQDALYQNQQDQFTKTYGTAGSQTEAQKQAYNQDILGLKYEDSGAIVNPFSKPVSEPEPEQPATIGCLDGTQPDANGCCTGEVYTDMGEDGFNCCPEAGGDCFPPIL
ncbi:MAG: TrbI/VirB10 family protein [Candidatus Enterousia sp.]